MEKDKAKSGNCSPKLHCSTACEPNRSTTQEGGGRQRERRTIKFREGRAMTVYEQRQFLLHSSCLQEQTFPRRLLEGHQSFSAGFPAEVICTNGFVQSPFISSKAPSPHKFCVAACALLLFASSGFQLCQNHCTSSFLTSLGSGNLICISVLLPISHSGLPFCR